MLSCITCILVSSSLLSNASRTSSFTWSELAAWVYCCFTVSVSFHSMPPRKVLKSSTILSSVSMLGSGCPPPGCPTGIGSTSAFSFFRRISSSVFFVTRYLSKSTSSNSPSAQSSRFSFGSLRSRKWKKVFFFSHSGTPSGSRAAMNSYKRTNDFMAPLISAWRSSPSSSPICTKRSRQVSSIGSSSVRSAPLQYFRLKSSTSSCSYTKLWSQMSSRSLALLMSVSWLSDVCL